MILSNQFFTKVSFQSIFNGTRVYCGRYWPQMKLSQLTPQFQPFFLTLSQINHSYNVYLSGGPTGRDSRRPWQRSNQSILLIWVHHSRHRWQFYLEILLTIVIIPEAWTQQIILEQIQQNSAFHQHDPYCIQLASILDIPNLFGS